MNAHQHFNLLMRTLRMLACMATSAGTVRPGMRVRGSGSGLLRIRAAQAGAAAVDMAVGHTMTHRTDARWRTVNQLTPA